MDIGKRPRIARTGFPGVYRGILAVAPKFPHLPETWVVPCMLLSSERTVSSPGNSFPRILGLTSRAVVKYSRSSGRFFTRKCPDICVTMELSGCFAAGDGAPGGGIGVNTSKRPMADWITRCGKTWMISEPSFCKRSYRGSTLDCDICQFKSAMLSQHTGAKDPSQHVRQRYGKVVVRSGSSPAGEVIGNCAS